MPSIKKIALVAGPAALALALVGVAISAHAAAPTGTSNAAPAANTAPAQTESTAPEPTETQGPAEAPEANDPALPNGVQPHADTDPNANNQFEGVQ